MWKYQRPGFYSERMGGAQRLPNGNTLLTDWDGDILEVDPIGRTVWMFQRPLGARIYRAYRVDFGWPAGPVQFPW